jgi:NAD(P)-dependent dehydrogenase (short-subunit alcohol dehydrogenase family)
MSLTALFRRSGPSGFGYSSTAEQVSRGLDLTGKTFLLTGANSGLGLETLRVLILRGATVLAMARSEAKARQACKRFGKRAIPMVCELSDPSAVRACVENVKAMGVTLDAIIANAGVMALPECETNHGIERHFFTNHIGHFILVNGLLDQLAENGRVVMVSSSAHRKVPEGGIQFDALDGKGWYSPWFGYGHSKLANMLFAKHLAKGFEGTERVSISVHPGVIKTNLIRHMSWWVNPVMGFVNLFIFKSAAEGAATQVFAATHPDATKFNGEFLSDCDVVQPTEYGRDAEMAERLWEKSQKIISALP